MKSKQKASPRRKGFLKALTVEHLPLFTLLCFAFLLRIWNVNWGLPQLYEEAIPLRFGMKLWNPGSDTIDFHFFVYPSFTYLLQFILQGLHFLTGYIFGTYSNIDAFLKVYASNPTIFAIIARLTSAVFDVGTIAVAYAFLDQFADRRTALVGAFMMSINVLLISEAHLINVDTPLTFFCVLSLYCLFRIYTTPTRKWYILSGIAVGLAAATKYHGGILIGALVVVHLLRSESFSGAIRSLKDRNLFYAAASSGLVFILFNPLLLFHLDDFILKLQMTEVHMEAGHLGLDSDTSTIGFYLLQSLPINLGVLLTVVSFMSFMYLLISRVRKNLVLLVIPILFIVLLGSWKMRADRYILPVIPFLVMSAAIGSVMVWDLILHYGRTTKLSGLLEANKKTVGVVATLVLAIPMLGNIVKYNNTISLPDTRTIASEWIQHNMPRYSAVATGPFGVELSNSAFLIMPIQFSAIGSERMAPFYDTRWYEDLDLLVASDFDYGRYKEDPVRYQDLLKFYDTLRTSWKLVHEIASNENQTGPTLWFYKSVQKKGDQLFEAGLIDRLLSSNLEDSRKIDFLGKLALILSVKGKSSKSGQLLTRLLAIDPENELAKKTLAQLSRQSNGREEKASSPEHENQIRNGRADSLLGKARNLSNMSRFKDAEKTYRNIIAIDNRNDSAYVELMLLYASQNNKAMVIQVLSEYLQVLPIDSPRYKAVSEQLNKLKSIPD